ncbi:hypothetical protein R3X27_25435 [Tropicimonas sp. TH_r6]|uniref:hypothetical protein n=1 Tax=Tropicimonas sp. TH_r6 TaxID=3082085 RepID=UPI002954B958|nr:hypothetical protein [Tropicimonas sp. TH_r6]MDV7146024.1 hypothetical protein [Tropicimonas sp. TH_r6]
MKDDNDRLAEVFRSALAAIHELVEPLENDDSGEARDRVPEDALSVEVREPWHSHGAGHDGLSEYRLLLATGGPAVRIIGRLDAFHEPETAVLEAQDWFLPWTGFETSREDDEALLTYARCFWFGE